MAQTDLTPELFAELGLDWAGLTAPLKGGNAGGEDIRYTPEFDGLAHARVEEDDTDQGIWKVDAKKADWRAVADQACALLTARSKDLQVAVWLTQALFHLHGPQGLAAGMAVLARLAKTLWPVLWPQPDGEDLDARMAPFFWLDARLAPELMTLEITEPDHGENRGYTYQQLVKARDLDRLAKNKPKAFQDAVADGEIPLDKVMQSVDRNSTEFLLDRWYGIRMVLAGLKRLSDALDAVARKDAPSFKGGHEVLGDMDRLFTRGLTERRALPAEAAPKSKVQEPEKGKKVSVPKPTQLPVAGPSGGPPAIKDRRTAYALLDQVADWLLAHEPHSPAPFLVKRAVSWERLSLGDVLTDLMANGTDINTTLKVLGITSDGSPASTRRRGGPNAEED